MKLPVLPIYQCHKKVQAAQIIGIINGHTLVLSGPATDHPPAVEVDADWLIRNPKLAVGGYFVVYEDESGEFTEKSYTAYSPAEPLEKGYTLADGPLNFGQAIEALKAGKRVARAGWNGKGMFVYMVEGATVDFENLRGAAKEAAIAATVLENGVQGSSRRVCSHIDMKAADGSLVIGWLASQTDMLAEDWGIVE